MGLCISRPEIDDVDNENTALLRGTAGQSQAEAVADQPADMSPEERAELQEQERLKDLQKKTTDVLMNIPYDSGFQHEQPSGGASRDYSTLLQQFSEQINLPLPRLLGPAEAPGQESSHKNIAVLLTEGHIRGRDIELVNSTIQRINNAVETVYIKDPGDCVVSLSHQDKHYIHERYARY